MSQDRGASLGGAPCHITQGGCSLAKLSALHHLPVAHLHFPKLRPGVMSRVFRGRQESLGRSPNTHTWEREGMNDSTVC